MLCCIFWLNTFHSIIIQLKYIIITCFYTNWNVSTIHTVLVLYWPTRSSFTIRFIPRRVWTSLHIFCNEFQTGRKLAKKKGKLYREILLQLVNLSTPAIMYKVNFLFDPRKVVRCLATHISNPYTALWLAINQTDKGNEIRKRPLSKNR